MPKPLSIAMTAVGAILLVFAAFAGDSLSSSLSRLFQGTPDARTITLLVLGALFLIIGIAGTMRSDRS